MRQDLVEKTPWNPSKKATARVLDKLPDPTRCPFCNGTHISIEKNSKIYHGKEYGEWPWIYFCNGCWASVGMHPFTSIPLGTLADSKTKTARKLVKEKFYAYIEQFNVSRNQAYHNLAEQMDIDKSTCHFGWFDVEQCNKADEALNQLLAGNKRTQNNPNTPLFFLLTML